MRMKMRQHAHLQAVGITFCLLLSPERRASRCCQCMSGRLQHLRCDHVNNSDSAQQETFSQCTAGQRAGGGNDLRPKCKVHWHRQPLGASRAAGLQSPTPTEPSSTTTGERHQHLHRRREGEWISVKIERSRACVGFWGLLWVSIDLFQHQWTWGAAPRRLP